MSDSHGLFDGMYEIKPPMHFLPEWFHGYAHKKYQLLRIHSLIFIAITSILVLVFAAPTITKDAFIIFFYTAPVWIFYNAKATIWYFWIHYRRHMFLDAPGQKPAVYEILLPRELVKSPRAMEIVFNTMYIKPSLTTTIQTHWKGNIRPWWSFEIVCDGGELHFYVWCWKRFAGRLHAALYSQYPGIQIVEVEDYAKKIKYIPGKNVVAGSNYVLGHDGGDAYPIRTYFDQELNKDVKVEYKVDPFTSYLEGMAVVKKGEMLCVQIMCQFSEDEGWKKRVKSEIEKIYESRKVEAPSLADPDQAVKMSLGLRPIQFELIKAMERSTQKLHFDVGIRGMYIADADKFRRLPFDTLNNLVKYYGAWGSPYYNFIVPDGESWHANFDYPWEDLFNYRLERLRRRLVDAYQHRSIFNPPFKQYTSVMTSEQLATIFHLPGDELQAVGLKRLESKQANPPQNLPT